MLRSVQERRLERLLRRIEELRAWRNAREVQIPDWQFTGSDGQTRQLRLGDFWPVHEVPVQLSASAQIPGEWAGQPVELELWLGGEGFVKLSTGYQAGLNPMHHRFPVTEKAKGGETIGIEVEAVPKGIFGSNIPEPRVERANLVIPQREVRGFERDLTMLYQACLQLNGHEVIPFLLDAAEAALSELADAWPTDSETSVSRYVLGFDNGLGSGVAAVPWDWVPEAIDAQRPTMPTWSLPHAAAPARAAAAGGSQGRHAGGQGAERAAGADQAGLSAGWAALPDRSCPYRPRLALAGARDAPEDAADLLDRARPDGSLPGFHLQPVFGAGLCLDGGGRPGCLRADQGAGGRGAVGADRRHVARVRLQRDRRRGAGAAGGLRAALLRAGVRQAQPGCLAAGRVRFLGRDAANPAWARASTASSRSR